jgi:hypothetical protein
MLESTVTEPRGAEPVQKVWCHAMTCSTMLGGAGTMQEVQYCVMSSNTGFPDHSLHRNSPHDKSPHENFSLCFFVL